MTVPTNTDQTYTQTNIRENLENFVYNVDPFRTPILNLAKRITATQSYHEWSVDALAAQNASNSAVQGADASGDALTAVGRMGNRCQIPQHTLVMSGTLQAVTASGATNTMAYQLAKKTKELKRDMEGIITSNTAQATGNGTTTGDITAGIQCFLIANSQFQTGGSPSSGANPTGHVSIGSETFGNGTTARTYNSTKVALAEATLKAAVLSTYQNSASLPPYLVCSPKNKQIISTFTGPGTRFIEVEDEVLQTAVSVYDSDFGRVKIIPDIFLDVSGDCYGLDNEFVKIAYLRPFQVNPLAKTGDADKKQMLCEFGLEISNERALYGIYDTTG